MYSILSRNSLITSATTRQYRSLSPSLSSQIANMPEYAGRVSEWVDNNKTYTKEVFPTLPTPWKMVDSRAPIAAEGKLTAVRKLHLT